MKQLKCQNCNANIETVGYGNIVICEYCGTQHILGKSVQDIYKHRGHPFIVSLIYAVIENCSLEILEQVCMELQHTTGNRAFNYENISGNQLTAKARELVLTAQRHVSLDPLAEILSKNSRGFALWLEDYNEQ